MQQNRTYRKLNKNTHICTFLTCNLNLFLHIYPTHQLDLPVAHDGAELAEVPHQTIEDVSDAFPLLTAHFLHTRKLCLQLHQTGLLHRKREEERVSKD